MNVKKIAIAAVFLGIYASGQQSSYFNNSNEYRWALAQNLYQTKIYNAAQFEYAKQYFHNQNLSNSQKEATKFFDNIIGVILQKNHAEQGLEAFIREYPNSAYFAQANLPLADYYLAKKDFETVLETLKKVNPNQLSQSENTDYVMKLGYAKFMTGDTKGAMQDLGKVYQNASEENRKDIAYMLGHLYYTDGQNDKTFQYFDTIKDDAKYSKLVRPYYIQIYFTDKNYDKAIAEGKELLNEDLSKDYRTEVNKIIGESYFMKGNYQEAYPYLKNYLENQQNPSESDLYEMGFVAAELGKYDEAVFYYNQLVNSDSALAQNAYYQLGNAYLQTHKKQEALSAFRSAYQMDYDAKVKQLSHIQYAKLSYDIGNPFEAAPQVIQNYIKQYPNSNGSEMNSLLVKSYLYSGNYKETLAAIDALPNSTSETDKIDQEVSFLLGTEEFNKQNYDDAEHYFLRSLEFFINKDFHNRAMYWLGQTYFQKGNYTSAIARYEQVLTTDFPEKQQLPYDLGYAYFKAGIFDKAQNYFKEYLKNPKSEFKSDAELRLADTYYAENQLNEAIAIYDKSQDAGDYTIFQKGMALGFKGDSVAKIKTLKSLISKFPNSEYVDDANYEIAAAYASNDDFNTSNEYFSKVIKNSTDKDLIANAQIYKAQNYIDQNQSEKALAELKVLGNQYKNTSHAQKITQIARPIYLKQGDITGYQNFAKSIGVNVDASELDEINLSTANQFYVNKDYKKAIPLYEKYLSQKPTGDGLYQAKYELGDSYYQSKNIDKSLLIFQEIANIQNDYREDAQTRLTQIYIANGNNSEAKKHLESLVNSSNSSIKNFANVELMKLYAEDKNLAQANKYADEVLANTKNSASVLEKARVIKARNLMSNGKDKDAQTAYNQLEKSSNTEVAAEALYAKAFYQNKANAYKSSNETIFKLANNYAAEEYWGAKALLVMAKNYIGLKDKYQATYTVDQVIANYQDFPDIITEAKEIKKGIK